MLLHEIPAIEKPLHFSVPRGSFLVQKVRKEKIRAEFKIKDQFLGSYNNTVFSSGLSCSVN